MKILNIKNRSKVIVFAFTDQLRDLEDKYKIVERLSDRIPKIRGIGYAGYNSKINLKFHIDWIIYGNDPINFKYKKIKSKTLLNITETLFGNCFDIVKNDRFYIFIFPTLSEFVIKKMGGSFGFNTNKSTITIGLYPAKNWKHNFKGTLAHELAHASVKKFHTLNKTTIGERLISEGIAENFRDAIVKGNSPPWTNSINKRQASLILKKLKPKMNSLDADLHNQVFHGTGKYPLWAGYTIGYYLVQDYLKKQETLDWKKIINTSPKKILKETIQSIWKSNSSF